MSNVQEYFQSVAPEWDDLRQGYFTEEVREAVIARAQPQPWMHAADIGCGTGFLAVGLAPLVAEMHCLDASPAMLDQARVHLQGCANVRFQVADGASLPLDEASVDLVVANMYLHHTPEPPKALAEMVRILRPGGQIVFSDMDEHREEWMRVEMADLWLGFPREKIATWLAELGLQEVLVTSPGQT